MFLPAFLLSVSNNLRIFKFKIMSLLPPVFSLLFMTVAIIGNSIAISLPLVSVSGIYDLHLFPSQDNIDYNVSETHLVSQWMHSFSLGLLLISFVLALISIFLGPTFSDKAQENFTIFSTVAISGAATCYVVAVATLLKIAADYKRIKDDFPLPTPEGKMEIGGIMDIVGVLFALVSAGLIISTSVKTTREGHVRLS